MKAIYIVPSLRRIKLSGKDGDTSFALPSVAQAGVFLGNRSPPAQRRLVQASRRPGAARGA